MTNVFSLELFRYEGTTSDRQALAQGKSDEDIYALLKESHPENAAARNFKSCREQVSWYRSQMKRDFTRRPEIASTERETKNTTDNRRVAGALDRVYSRELSGGILDRQRTSCSICLTAAQWSWTGYC